MDVEGNMRKLNSIIKRKWVVYKVMAYWIKSTFVRRASADDIKAWNEIFILGCFSVQWLSSPFEPLYVIVLRQDLNSVFTVFLASIQVSVALSRHLVLITLTFVLPFFLTFLASSQISA